MQHTNASFLISESKTGEAIGTKPVLQTPNLEVGIGNKGYRDEEKNIYAGGAAPPKFLQKAFLRKIKRIKEKKSAINPVIAKFPINNWSMGPYKK